LNIISNAIDACDKDLVEREDHVGRVCVSTCFDRKEGFARVTVEDNGPGIEPGDIEQIFSLFVSRKGSRGTGLGLPVSQKIMKEHGGRIRVESEVGKGSRFMLELPALLPDINRTITTVPEGEGRREP
jgi:signal transduction histidine kinase